MQKETNSVNFRIGVTGTGQVICSTGSDFSGMVEEIGIVDERKALVLFGTTMPEVASQRANEWGADNIPVMRQLVAAQI